MSLYELADSLHFQMVKCFLRYIQGTLNLGYRLLVQCPMKLYAFLDADWAGCPTTRRSTIGFCTFLSSNCISWSAKKKKPPWSALAPKSNTGLLPL